jgi:tetratricopeptide (TPR) repeat protein
MQTTKQILSAMSSTQLLKDAQASIKAGKYYEAMHYLNAFLLFQPRNHVAILHKALCYLYIGKTSKSLYLIDLVNEENPELAETHFCYAEYYKLMLDYQLALHHINVALSSDGENASYYRLAAEICYLNNDIQDAYHLINRAIVVSPFREELYVWRAIILNKLAKPQIALHDLQRAISLSPQYVDAHRLRAKILIKSGQAEEALISLRKAKQFERLQNGRISHAA